MPDDYQPVTVEAARRIAREFGKDVVVILSLDDEHGLTHTTTYGRTSEAKQLAAALGEHLAKAAGCDLAEARRFEDFRYRSQAEAAQTIERLTEEIERLRSQGANVHE